MKFLRLSKWVVNVWFYIWNKVLNFQISFNIVCFSIKSWYLLNSLCHIFRQSAGYIPPSHAALGKTHLCDLYWKDAGGELHCLHLQTLWVSQWGLHVEKLNNGQPLLSFLYLLLIIEHLSSFSCLLLSSLLPLFILSVCSLCESCYFNPLLVLKETAIHWPGMFPVPRLHTASGTEHLCSTWSTVKDILSLSITLFKPHHWS